MSDNPITSSTAELFRIDFSGTIWFGAATIAASLPLTGLLIRGWRPADLSQGPETVWWIGSALVVLGLAALAYAGCPVKGPNVRFDTRTKSVAVRAGLAAYGIGGVAVLLAVLLSPSV